MKRTLPLTLPMILVTTMFFSACDAPQKTGNTERTHTSESNANEDRHTSLLRIEAETMREELAVAERRLIKLTNGLGMRLDRHSIDRANAARNKHYSSWQRERDLRNEIEILERKLRAVKAETSVYDDVLRTDGSAR